MNEFSPILSDLNLNLLNFTQVCCSRAPDKENTGAHCTWLLVYIYSRFFTFPVSVTNRQMQVSVRVKNDVLECAVERCLDWVVIFGAAGRMQLLPCFSLSGCWHMGLAKHFTMTAWFHDGVLVHIFCLSWIVGIYWVAARNTLKLKCLIQHPPNSRKYIQCMRGNAMLYWYSNYEQERNLQQSISPHPLMALPSYCTPNQLNMIKWQTKPLSCQ